MTLGFNIAVSANSGPPCIQIYMLITILGDHELYLFLFVAIVGGQGLYCHCYLKCLVSMDVKRREQGEQAGQGFIVMGRVGLISVWRVGV